MSDDYYNSTTMKFKVNPLIIFIIIIGYSLVTISAIPSCTSNVGICGPWMGPILNDPHEFSMKFNFSSDGKSTLWMISWYHGGAKPSNSNAPMKQCGLSTKVTWVNDIIIVDLCQPYRDDWNTNPQLGPGSANGVMCSPPCVCEDYGSIRCVIKESFLICKTINNNLSRFPHDPNQEYILKQHPYYLMKSPSLDMQWVIPNNNNKNFKFVQPGINPQKVYTCDNLNPYIPGRNPFTDANCIKNLAEVNINMVD